MTLSDAELERYARHIVLPRFGGAGQQKLKTASIAVVGAGGIGSGAIPALAAAGMQVSDIDLWEINEAFATVPLKTIRDLEIDPERVNVNGGAIALGHPLGMSGGRLITMLVHELRRTGGRYGLATMCIGVGQGIATVVERLDPDA